MSELTNTDQTVTATHSLSDDIPLYKRFPALRSLPRASLCITPSPLQRIIGIPGVNDLWIKRDDLNAPLIGGNKVRALEFLLGSVRAGDTVLTLGGAGSTHVLATSIHARRLGAGTMAVRWRHDMNEIADIVSERLGKELEETRIGRTPAGAMLRGLGPAIALNLILTGPVYALVRRLLRPLDRSDLATEVQLLG